MKKTIVLVITSLLMTLACGSNSGGGGETPPPEPPGPPEEEKPEPPKTGDFVSMQNGKLYTPGGEELALWGVNLQPCLSWEYRDRLRARA